MRRAVLGATAVALLLTGCSGSHATWQDPVRHASPPVPGIDLSKGRSDPVADPVYPGYGNPAIDVLHYDLDLSWSPGERKLTGEATLTVRATRRIDEITLDFTDHLAVAAATVDGRPARASRDGLDLIVPLSKPAPKDRRLTLVVRYSGPPEPVEMPSTRGDFAEGLGLRVEDNGAIWTMQEPYGALTWYPVNDQPSDEALYDIAVTVPDGWAAVASGQFLGRSPSGAGVRYRWRSGDPVGSYVTTLAVDKFQQYEDAVGDIALTYWVPKRYDGYQLRAIRRTPEILEWLQRKFGPYPFSSAGAVAVDSDSAMETQTMVTMGGGIAKDAPAKDAEAIYTQVLVHEYSHQYFGDSVSPRDWRAVWLNEGFATYVEMLWVTEHSDYQMTDYVEFWRDRDRQSRPDAGPPGDYDPEMFAESNVYVGPALMLHELRGKIGDKTFFAMCRAWAQRNKNTSQDRESFTRFVADFTGRDLKPVIDKWLDSKTTPR